MLFLFYEIECLKKPDLIWVFYEVYFYLKNIFLFLILLLKYISFIKLS